MLIDGAQYIAHVDKNAIAAGGAAFETLDHSECLVDEVKITAASAPGQALPEAAEGLPLAGAGLDAASYQTLKVGDRDPGVKRMRDRLYELGYYKNRYDHDRYTESTADIVALFQQANGLPADGIATPETQALMFSDKAMPRP